MHSSTLHRGEGCTRGDGTEDLGALCIHRSYIPGLRQIINMSQLVCELSVDRVTHLVRRGVND